MSSRLAVFSTYFCTGIIVGYVGCARHLAWMSKVHSHALQIRYASLEAYADECEGMERTLSTRGIHIAHLTRIGDERYPFVRFLPFPPSNGSPSNTVAPTLSSVH